LRSCHHLKESPQARNVARVSFSIPL
jgi:hypothetical protein